MNDLHQSWGARIRKRREELHLSQLALAEALGITQPTISKIESGRQSPSDDLKWRIAGVLRMTVVQLFPYPAVVPPYPERVA